MTRSPSKTRPPPSQRSHGCVDALRNFVLVIVLAIRRACFRGGSQNFRRLSGTNAWAAGVVQAAAVVVVRLFAASAIRYVTWSGRQVDRRLLFVRGTAYDAPAHTLLFLQLRVVRCFFGRLVQ